MIKINVIMLYTSQDPPGFEKSYHYELKKIFTIPDFQLVPCEIRLADDAIESFNFINPVYDIEDNAYTITNMTYEGVHRYYHGDAEEIMSKVIDRYIKYGWSCKKIMKPIYTE